MSSAQQVEYFVRCKIDIICSKYSESARKAALATLRKGVGKHLSASPELWGEVIQGMPHDMLSQNGTPSYEEWAVFTAMSLFAMHQQGKDISTSPMNQPGTSLGTAVGRLVGNSEDNRERIWKRFIRVVTANTIGDLSYNLRNIIQLLKAENIGLDYAALAKDIYLFQLPKYRDKIKLLWGQDFYRIKKEDEENNEEE